MRLSNFWWGLAATLSIAVACVSTQVDYTPLPPKLTPFEQICELAEETYGKACGDLPLPIVVISDIVDYRYRGVYYPGEDYIFINSTAKDKYLVIIHETVHYVLDHIEALAYSTGRCESEQRAREWTAKITNTPLDTTWWERYNCKREQ